MKLVYTDEFKRDLKKIRDIKIQARVKKIIQKIIDNPETGSCTLSIETFITPELHNVLRGDEYASNKDVGTLVLERGMPRLWKNRKRKYSF